jgi:fibrillarin-like pre-rRNA processing protein
MIPIDSTGGTVYTENSNLYTISSSPGIRVYGEKIVRKEDKEYREWNPRKSKLAAYLKIGGRFFPVKRDSRILYLGASSGTTPSHLSDIATGGKIFCVEFSPRMFRDLVKTCTSRPNMLPILGDAANPEAYQFAIGTVDFVYSDVAQKRQVDIITDNMNFFYSDLGMLVIKSRSEDVTSQPSDIYKESEKRLKERGFTILDAVDLEPYEDSHRMVVFERA